MFIVAAVALGAFVARAILDVGPERFLDTRIADAIAVPLIILVVAAFHRSVARS